MTNSAPISIPLDEPTTGTARRFDFDHIPKLGPYKPGDLRGSLLPKEGGRPGLTYLQAPLKYARQLEAAGWFPMHDSCRYTIVGPKGSIDMELMAQGRLIEGLAASSVKCICLQAVLVKSDGTRINPIQEATGLDPLTGFPPSHNVLIEEAPSNEAQVKTQDPGIEAGGEQEDPQQEDPPGEEGQSEPVQPSGGGKGRGNTRRS